MEKQIKRTDKCVVICAGSSNFDSQVLPKTFVRLLSFLCSLKWLEDQIIWFCLT